MAKDYTTNPGLWLAPPTFTHMIASSGAAIFYTELSVAELEIFP